MEHGYVSKSVTPRDAFNVILVQLAVTIIRFYTDVVFIALLTTSYLYNNIIGIICTLLFFLIRVGG
jgi:hypothetical protein